MAQEDVEIRLGFTADVNQAQQQLQQLQNTLSNLSTNTLTTNNFNKDLSTSISAVNQLNSMLDKSKTAAGTLDLSKFAVSLKNSGVSLQSYANQLSKLGSEGVVAFAQLTQAVTQAQTPLIQAKSVLDGFVSQLERTAKIQISYGIFNGITDAFRNAYNYAQDLNESLTNIQVITSKSSDDMAEFARNANKAAKALSTTTTAYSDAALIYYQQGLSDEDVAERTETTVKLANVTGEAASDISSYMTAIWNNFDDGSESLEYYADVITKLGASTASSSSEIAEGLSQFSAVANTVGLSYEYATSALATVVAQTRQSADTVGNSFKTIFARLESLNMGETLDDETTLTKYSAALEKVGVTIKEGNGDLKDMDDILDELGSKWENLNDEQKNSLAYTVAGARQYTNFIALMDNWQKVQKNIDLAEDSEGTLDEQAEIYADSWEAATKHVKASLQGLYDTLIDDDFFIDLTNSIATIISSLDNMVEKAGGISSVLITIGTIATTLFQDKIIRGIDSVKAVLMPFFSSGRAQLQQLKDDFNKTLDQMIGRASNSDTAYLGALSTSRENLNKVYDTLQANTQKLTIYQQQSIQSEIEGLAEASKKQLVYAQEVDTYDQLILKYNKELVLIKQQLEEKQKNSEINKKAIEGLEEEAEEIRTHIKLLKEKRKESLDNSVNINSNIESASKSLSKDIQVMTTTLPTATQAFMNMASAAGSAAMSINSIKSIVTTLTDDSLSGWEKFTSVLMSASFAIPAISTAIKALNVETIKSNALATISWATCKLLGTSTVQYTQAEWNATAADLARQGALKGLNSEQRKSLIYNTMQGNSTMALSKFADAAKTKIAGLGASVSSLGSSISVAFGGEALTGTTALAAGIGAIGVAIAAVAAIAGVAYLAYKEWEAQDPASNIKKLNKELEALQSQYDSTAEAYDNLINSIDDYQSAQDSIEKLTEGTTEWKEAIQNANKEALELLDTYPQLADAMKVDANGQITFDEGALESAKAQMGYQLATEQQLIEANKISTYEWQSKKAAQDTGKEYTYTVSYDGQETVLNATKEQMLAVVDAVNKNGNSILANSSELAKAAGISDDLAEQIVKDKEAVLELVDTTNANTKAADALTLAMVQSYAQNNLDDEHQSAYDNSKGQSQLDYLAASRYDKYMTAGTNIMNNKTDAEIHDEYAKLMGWDVTSTKNGWGTGTFTLSDGTTQKVDDETMRAALASNYAAQNSVTSSIDEYAGRLTDEINNAVAVGLQNGLSTAESEELGQFIGDLMVGNTDEISSIIGTATEAEIAQISEAINTEGFITDEAAANAGYKDADAYITALKEELATYDPEEAAVARARKEEEAWQSELDSSAEELGTTSKALENYVKHLQATNDGLADNRELALQSAEANIKFSKGIDTLSDVFEDDADIIKAANKDSLEYWETIGKIQDALADVFGVEVSSDYVEENLEKIQKLADGDTSSLQELQYEAAKDYIVNVVVSEEGKTALNSVIDELYNIDQNSDIAIGMSVEGMDDAIANINKLLKTGKLTAEEVQSAMNAIGYNPDIKYKTIDSEPQVTHTESVVSWNGHSLGKIITDNTSTTKTQVPYIAASNTADTTGDTGAVNGAGLVKTTSKSSLSGSISTSAKESGSSSSSKENKNLEDEKERYYEINQQLDQINANLDEISTAKDRAFGQDKLKAIDQEIAEYEKLVDVQKEYINQINSNLSSDMGILAGYGAKFNSDGTLANYDELMAAQVTKYNANKESDTADDEYEAFKTALSNYEDSLDKSLDAAQELIEYQNQIYDDKLEKITYIVEFKTQVDDFGIKTLEFLMDQLDDKAYDTAESIALIGKEMERNQSKYNTYKQEMLDILDLASDGQGEAYLQRILSGENLEAIQSELNLTEDAWNELLDAAENVMNSASDMKELWEEYLEGLDEFWDSWADQFDEVSDKIEHLSKITNSYKNIINLIGADKLGISDETMARIDELSTRAATDQYNNTKAELEAANKLREEYIKNGWDQDEEYAEQWKHVLEECDRLEEQMYDDMQSMVEAFQEQLNDAIDATISNWSEAISGMYDDIESLSSAFDRAQELDDLYMDTYEQSYNISKLVREMSKSIADTDSVKAKQELSSLMDEINDKQATGVKLSQYEYDAYEKEYQLLLAKQALEDAQNAKNSVRMTRDNEGNLGYVYTADQSAIDEAAQAYDDAVYDYAQLNSESLLNAQQQMLQLDTWLQEQMQNATELTEQEIAEIMDYYNTQMEYWQQQMETIFDNNSAIIKIAEVDYWGLATTFEDTTLSQVSNIKTLNTYVKLHEQTASSAWAGIADAVDTYNSQIAEYVEITEGKVNDELDKVQDGLEETEEKTAELSDTFDEELEEMSEAAVEFQETWEEAVQNAIDEAGNLGTAISDLGDAYVDNMDKAYDLADANRDLADSYRELQDAMNSGGGSSSTNNTTPDTTTTRHTYVAKGSVTGMGVIQQTFDTREKAEAWINKQTQNGKFPNDFTITELATGGYTGEWGDSGKLAMLHQKELVLNADDTKNFLGAIDIVRDIADSINLQQYGANASLSTGQLGQLGQMEQNVTITAEFPNATDHTEIEIAFDDLMNRASQLMNQKN